MMRWSTTLMMSSGDSRPQWARTNGKPYAPKANGKGEGVIQTSSREWPVPALAALRAAELPRRHHRHNWGSWQYRLRATCQQTPPSRD
jgi:hypothetical protein